MSNSQYYQFLFSKNPMLTMLECNAVIDSGQSTGTRNLKGGGIKSLNRIAVGTYQLTLDGTFARQISGMTGFISPVTGSTAVTALTPGNVYIIATVGTTTTAQWQTAGVPANVVPAPGVAFLAAATSSGSGTVVSPSNSGITTVEGVGDPNTTIIGKTSTALPYLIFQTLGPTNSSTTTLIPKDPVDGSVMNVTMFFRNSSVKGKGE